MSLFLCSQSDDADSDSSDGVVDLHSTESDERRLTNQADEALSAYCDLQKLILTLGDTIQRTVSCYDLKLYVACIRCGVIYRCQVLNVEHSCQMCTRTTSAAW